MRVYSIKSINYNNSDRNNTSFKELIIPDKNKWNPMLLDVFVHNENIQQFTRVLHFNKLDVKAVYNDDISYGNISLFAKSRKDNEKENFITSFFAPFGENLQKFSINHAFSQVENLFNTKLNKKVLIKDSKDYLDAFNRSLESDKD